MSNDTLDVGIKLVMIGTLIAAYWLVAVYVPPRTHWRWPLMVALFATYIVWLITFDGCFGNHGQFRP